MAFSFRAGTNWCHDFPKLAKESGFCFNVHRTRVRVDWNRISSIDIDRVIRERDFLTVDDNVNNVVDYSLETEYDVKILDPNFVKLFRLAQLSVEYLLYCKQYLDHSVIILKDELRLKIEDNAMLKEEINALQESIKNLNEKIRERNRIIESKLGDSNGELFKCPHCVKTFIAPTFVSAHIARRHAHLSDPYMMPPSLPAHEQYRVEAEKLHDEIKTLKERLNRTERVIRNESEKNFDFSRTDNGHRTPDIYEKGEYTNDRQREERIREQQRKYQDEIASLKSMLFSEVRNLKQKDVSLSPIYHVQPDTKILNLEELIKKQEKEIHTLRDQLREQITPNLKNVQEKLHVQEQHGKVINERLEKQTDLDTDLSVQLKISQETSRQMKELYESKINELEMHSKAQKQMLEAQGMRLAQLAHELWESREPSQSTTEEKKIDLQSKSSSQNIVKKMPNIRGKDNDHKTNVKNNKHGEPVCDNVGSLSSRESPKILTSPIRNRKPCFQNKDNNELLTGKGDYFETGSDSKSARIAMNLRDSDAENTKRYLVENLNLESLHSSRSGKAIQQSSQRNSKHQTNVNLRNLKGIRAVSDSKNLPLRSNAGFRGMKSEQSLDLPRTKAYVRQKTVQESEDSENYSETESESSTSKSECQSASEDEIKNEEDERKLNSHYIEDFNSPTDSKEWIRENSEILQELKEHLRDVFDGKLKDLGIDPEWDGIPKATFKQKMETVIHHQNINAKKINDYNYIRQKILEEISQRLNKNIAEPAHPRKMSSLDRIMSKFKIKTANALKQRTNFEFRTPIVKSPLMSSYSKASKPMSNLEVLPSKMNESNIHELRSNKNSTVSRYKKEPEPRPRSRSTLVRNTKPSYSQMKDNTEIVEHNKFVEELEDSTSLEEQIQSHDGIVCLSKSETIPKAKKFGFRIESKKSTLMPKTSVESLIEQSYSSADEDSNNKLSDHKLVRSLPGSPKNNKSVLKSTTGSVGSLIKKKVLFDLDQSVRNGGKSTNQITGENLSAKKTLPEYSFEDEEVNDDDWNISNMSDDDVRPQKAKSPSMDSIVLKTSQSSEIAKISKKIQDQLNISHQKPIGAVEAMFLAKPSSKETKGHSEYRESTNMASSSLDNPYNPLLNNQPTEINKHLKATSSASMDHESDVETGIEELLKTD
ncbi:zinc finger protein Dzip1 [Neodiprion virginianus]|uniref:zinc finger protein Dzip1 n=1 Tax=Neodiprion virginianus TaxID=2961670 RepID=UPI001EE70D89|nr:zinc finger protein Dzip1 [Neodiprion virginianus]XP_046605715.1 zinc finger protein Dzip1 [Neodiprion virginianus]